MSADGLRSCCAHCKRATMARWGLWKWLIAFIFRFPFLLSSFLNAKACYQSRTFSVLPLSHSAFWGIYSIVRSIVGLATNHHAIHEPELNQTPLALLKACVFFFYVWLCVCVVHCSVFMCFMFKTWTHVLWFSSTTVIYMWFYISHVAQWEHSVSLKLTANLNNIIHCSRPF